MSIERGPNKTELGWIDILQANDERIKAAARQVCSFRGITEKEYEVTIGARWADSYGTHKTISFNPTQEELREAPEAIKKVLKDIGVGSLNQVSLELGIPMWNRPVFYSSFLLTIRPEEITDDRIGITLSPEPGKVELIGLKRNGELLVKESMFFGEFGLYSRFRIKGKRASNVEKFYKDIIGDPHPGGKLDHHPYMVEILTSAADWVTALLESRKKPGARY